MTAGADGTRARIGRLTLALGGGYAFAAGFVAIVGSGLPHLGMIRSEAVTLGGMLGMLVYLAVIIWAVGSARPYRAAFLIVGGATAMIIFATVLARG